jgi:hypothetical protein
MEAKDLDEQQLRQARHHDARTRWCRLGVLQRIGDVGAHPVGGGSVRRAHHEHRREDPKAGVEQRVPRVQVAADHIGQLAVRSVADHRHLPPGWHLQERGYRDEAGVPYAAHAVLVAVRKHDDVATPRPVLVTVVNSDPAGAAGDDVEQDDAVGIWPEDLRCLPRGQRLVRPWLAVLGSEEYRAFQSQPLKRRLECRRRRPWSRAVTRSDAPVSQSWSSADPP